MRLGKRAHFGETDGRCQWFLEKGERGHFSLVNFRFD